MGRKVRAVRADARLWRGIFCTLSGAALWGFSGTCAQFLLSNYDVAPTFVTVVRMTGAGLLFLAFLIVRRRDRLVAMLRDRRTVARLVVFGAGGLYLCQITYVVVIGYTNAGTATVLQCTGIVFTMLFACLIARTPPHLREFAGLVAAVAATWLIATQGDLSTLSLPLPGLVWGIISGLSVSFYVMYPKRLFAQWGSLAVTGLGMLTGGIAAFAVWASGIVDGRAAVPSRARRCGMAYARRDNRGGNLRGVRAVPARCFDSRFGEGKPARSNRAGKRHTLQRRLAGHGFQRRRLDGSCAHDRHGVPGHHEEALLCARGGGAHRNAQGGGASTQEMSAYLVCSHARMLECESDQVFRR